MNINEKTKGISFSSRLCIAFALALIVLPMVFDGKPPSTNAGYATRHHNVVAPFDQRQCDAKNNGPFNGRTLYLCATIAVAEHHKNLVSPDLRRSFLKEWQHKFDQSGLLETEEGTLKAITEMVLGVKGRFDFVFTPEAVAQNNVIEKGQMAGIGASVAMPRAGGDELPAKLNLPEHASPQLIAMLKMKKAPAAIISRDNPLLVIADPAVGTPAYKGGMKKGDIIFAVNGNEVSGKTSDAVIKEIRGEPGSAFKLTVMRRGEKLDLEMVRAVIELNTTSEKKIGEVGYLRIDHFESMRVVDDVHNSLDSLCFAIGQETVDSHADCDSKALIVDLRGNPGGRFDAVVVISEFFLDKGNLSSVMLREGDKIVRTDFTLTADSLNVKEGDRSTDHKRHFNTHFPMDRKLVVLVNEYSASGAEALSTILQQQRNAVVVGQQTRGKGVGQCPISLPFGYEANFICMEYLAGGKAVDWLGVTPDVSVQQGKDSSQDAQLEAALRIARGEVVVKTDPKVQAERDSQIVAERKKAYDREVEDTLKRFFN